MNWYYRQDGRPCGPVSEELLAKMIADGRLSPATAIWREGLPSWVSAAAALAVAPAIDLPVAAPPTTPPAPPPAFTNFRPAAAAAPPAGPVRARASIAATTSPTAFAYSRPVKPISRQRASRAPMWIAICVCGLLFAAFSVWGIANSLKHNKVGIPAGYTAGAQSVARNDAAVAPIADPRAEPEELAATASEFPSEEARDETSDLEAPMHRPRIGNFPPADPKSEPDPGARGGGALESEARDDEAAPVEAAREVGEGDESESETASEQPSTASTKPQESKCYYQELQMRKASRFDMEGISIPQQSAFRVLSELSVSPESESGKRDVVQTVLETRLVGADDAMRATITKALEKLRGRKMIYKVDRRGELVEFKSEESKVEAAPLAEAGGIEALGGLDALGGLGAAAGLGAGKELLGADGFASSSVMDDDGWQELAEYTFFRPDQEFGPRRPLQRQRTHDWGPLGAWNGETTFTWQGEKQGNISIAFAHALTYSSPKVGAGRGSLPFDIAAAEFAPPKGMGTIAFDQKNQRVVNVEEQFAVRGAIAANLLGASARLQIEEQQQISLWIFEQNPWREENGKSGE